MSDRLPKVGDTVIYQTDGRNGLDYELPAIVTCTYYSHPGDYPDGTPNPLPVPSSPTHVHLTVLTPGGFGSEFEDVFGEMSGYRQDALPGMPPPVSFKPGSGTYVEHDVSLDVSGTRRSWRPR